MLNSALLTDLYELTMAYGYWKQGLANRKATFTLFYRRPPFGGSFAIAAGLQPIMEWIENFHFTQDDIAYLATLQTSQKKPLFEPDFLDYLATLKLQCDIEAIEEGTVVFPYEPLLRVQGPILHAQLLESACLNTINFQTLIATKAARLCRAAEGDPVIEFGLRRAQGVDGALAASRAAYIGGCSATSNVLAGQRFGIPVKGTQAHSWVMTFDTEREAFDAYAQSLPQDCLFLLDTYNTIEGAKHAVAIAKERLDSQLFGVRIDSGDLTKLSREVRKILDAEGLSDTKIMVSNELDECIIRDLKQQGAKIDIWGVGTSLVTGKDHPALDGVYKLTALQDAQGIWRDKIKISNQVSKITNPGILQVRRFFSTQGTAIRDMIYDVHSKPTTSTTLIDPTNPVITKAVPCNAKYRDLLIPIFQHGKRVYQSPSLTAIQDKAFQQLREFPSEIQRFLYPEPYFVGLEHSIYERKKALIQAIRE